MLLQVIFWKIIEATKKICLSTSQPIFSVNKKLKTS